MRTICKISFYIQNPSLENGRGRACAKDFIYQKFFRRHEREIRALFSAARGGGAIEEVRKREKATCRERSDR